MDLDLELDLDVGTDAATRLLTVPTSRRSIPARRDEDRMMTEPPMRSTEEGGGRRRQRPRGYSPDVGGSSNSPVLPVKKEQKRVLPTTFTAPRPVQTSMPPPNMARAASVAVEPRFQPRQRVKTVNRYSPGPATTSNENKPVTPKTPAQPTSERIRLSDLTATLERTLSFEEDFTVDWKKLKIKQPSIKRTSSANSRRASSVRSGTPSRADSRASSVATEITDDGLDRASPLVRMADIGAAPFTPSVPAPSPSTSASSRKGKRSESGRPTNTKPSIGMIKLPRRHSLERVLKDDVIEEKSSELAATSDTVSVDEKPEKSVLPTVKRQEKKRDSGKEESAEKHNEKTGGEEEAVKEPKPEELEKVEKDNETMEVAQPVADVVEVVRPKRLSAGKSRQFIAEAMGLSAARRQMIRENEEVSTPNDVDVAVKEEKPVVDAKKPKQEKSANDKKDSDEKKETDVKSEEVVTPASTSSVNSPKSPVVSQSESSTIKRTKNVVDSSQMPCSSSGLSDSNLKETNRKSLDDVETVRRSGRSSNLTPKMREMASERPKPTSSTAEFKVTVKKNSALAIKNTPLFRRNRSPSPVHSSPVVEVTKPKASSSKPETTEKVAPETEPVVVSPDVTPEEPEPQESKPNVQEDVKRVVEPTDDRKAVLDSSFESQDMPCNFPYSLVPYDDTDETSLDGNLMIDEEGDENGAIRHGTPEPETKPNVDSVSIIANIDSQQDTVDAGFSIDSIDRFDIDQTTMVEEKPGGTMDCAKVEEEPTDLGPAPETSEKPTPEETAKAAEVVQTKVSPSKDMKPGRSKGRLLNKVASPVKETKVLQSPNPQTPSGSDGVRSSRRIVKPTRYDDFVITTPMRREPVKGEKEPENRKERLPGQEKREEDTVKEEPVAGPDQETSAVKTEMDVVPPLPIRISPIKPAFTMKTRRRSSLEKTRPIKIKLRMSGQTASVIENTGAITSETGSSQSETEMPSAPSTSTTSTTTVSLPPSKKSLPSSSSSKGSRLPRWWVKYVPSKKPVLEDIVYQDGSVEKVGIAVNIVMDHLLATVCDDGIKRHNQLLSSKDKKARASAVAKQRYYQKKEEFEKLKAECTEKGEEPPVFSQTLISPRRLMSPAGPFSSVTGEEKPLVRAQRTKKGEIYKQNEFLLKSARQKRAAELEEEEMSRKAFAKIAKQMNRETNQMIEEEERNRKRKESTSSAVFDVRGAPSRGSVLSPPTSKKQIPFSSIVNQRKKAGSVLDISLMPTLTPEPPVDFFYRDILSDQVTSVTDAEVEEVDIMGADSESEDIDLMDDSIVENVPIDTSATILAEQIERLMMRRLYPEEETYGVGHLYDRILEETEVRRALVVRTMDLITEFYVAETAATGRHAQAKIFNSAMRLATLLRDLFDVFSEKRRDNVIWVHRLLIEMLPIHFLASYLVLLRYCRSLVFSNITKLVKSTLAEFQPWPEVTQLIIDYLSTKMVDPDIEYLNRTVSTNCLSDVVFLLVSPAFSVGDYHMKAKYHETAFRWLKQMGHPDSEHLKMTYSDDYDDTSLAEVCDDMIATIIKKVRVLTRQHRDRRIVLVGWQTTCVFNHRAVQLIHGVSAIINFAFPVLTEHGPRGTADDDILLTYCPSLFIVGAQAEDFDPIAMKEMRAGMLVNSGLVVVGHADCNLLVSTTVLSQMNMTQRTVFRAVVEQVCDFLSLEETKKEKSHLIPLEMNSVYNVDTSLISSRDKTRKGDQVTVSTAKEEKQRVRKRKYDLAVPSPVPHMPSLSAETSMSTNEARNRFDQVIKRSVPPSPAEIRRRVDDIQRATVEKKKEAGFREPKAPATNGPALHRASPLASPALPTSQSQSNLLNPASISLN